MDRETARQEIKQNWRRIIRGMTDTARERVNGKESYICPLCGHGTNGDGLTDNPKSTDGNGLKCFGCGFSGDIIDLYRKQTGADYNTALSLLANEIGITIDPYRPDRKAVKASENDFNGTNDKTLGKDKKNDTESAGAPTEGNTDFTAYYRECAERIKDPAASAYLESRGISLATAEAYQIGFDPKADPAGAGIYTPRIIIPTTDIHYIARAIDPGVAKRYRKMNPKGSTPYIFNWRALYAESVKEVFVVEGAFDALSLLEIGVSAISLNSVANVKTLLEQLGAMRTEATLILCLDNDEAGRKALEPLRQGLQKINIPYITADISGGYKDPNERLQKDREGFIEAVQDTLRQNASKPDNISFYIDTMMAQEIAEFKSDIKTGYSNLDRLSGGLYTGLYVIAAISSLGKTTFTHQMGDQIAAAGHDVLYFSLEQSRLEMASKSLARITAQTSIEKAVTSLSIRKGYMTQEVLKASERYKATAADRLNIIEGNFACDISFIGDYIRRYTERNGVKPVVIIDYLQILQPEERNGWRQTTKETVDSTVTQLKRMSRELGLTVIAICSVNRTNYLTPVDFESLKESGNIEYTADVIWGLQLHCINDPLFEKAGGIIEKRERISYEKAKNPRDIDLVCLKNRYGIANYSCRFEYYPANDLFVPADCISSDIQKKSGRRI